jgi:hypothetical protein
VGLESTPEAYIEHLVQIFREVRRVLRSDGVVALNLGDSYWGGKGKSGYELPHEAEGRRAKGETFQTGHNVPGYMDMRPTDGKHPTIKPLDLCLTPFRVILALQADGWYIRSVLPWIKRSCMPESINGWRWEQHRVKVGNEGRDQARRGQGTSEVQFQNHSGNTVYSDAKWQDCPGCPTCAPNGGLVLRRGSGRPTTAHEWLFLLSKSSPFFFDTEGVNKATPRMSGVIEGTDFADKSNTLIDNFGLEEAEVKGLGLSVPTIANGYFLIAECIRLATSILNGAQSQKDFGLSFLNSKIGHQDTNGLNGYHSPSDPLVNYATTLATRFMRGEIAAKEFMEELNSLCINLGDGHQFEELRRLASFDDSQMDTNGDTAVRIENASKVGQIKFIHDKEYNIEDTTLSRPLTELQYLFLLTKSSSYFYDSEAVKAQVTEASLERQRRGVSASHKNTFGAPGQTPHSMSQPREHDASREVNTSRNARTSDWFFDSLRAILDGENAMLFDEGGEPLAMVVNPHGWPEAHFATYPERLVEPLIKAATSKGGNCPRCGAPWARVVERQSLTEREIGRRPNTYHCKEVADRGDLGQCAKYALTNTLGWRPTCACGAGLEPDDLEFIFTPTGHRIAADPSLVTGRAGYNRPRGADEGSRPITRYEQRRYAEQLRNSPHRAEMEQEAGSAFAHYIRTDKSGARPIPPDLLEAWIERGWLVRVALPEQKPLEPIPAVVLDPFVGSGTTCLVAKKLGRRFVGIDLSEEYVQMARRRVGTVLL